MNKSILVLDENSVIHGLITSALEAEGLTLHHEFNPGKYVERASSLMPDLILIGNSEHDPDYEVCRTLKASQGLAEVPMVLLAGSKEALTRDQITRLQVDGVVRKPFEASDLQQQVSKHLDLVDLIGSAYEYRQSQSSIEEGPNPLANLDVLDDEVLGLLRGGQPAPAAQAAGEEAPVAGAPVVDDEVLAETLQPERAFEPVEPEAEEEPRMGPRYDSLETLEGEFPTETLEIPESEAQLDELGAADVLEEETPEEAVFEPQGFDQELGEPAQEAAPRATLDDIEVELPEQDEELGALADEGEEGTVDLFESDLAEEPGVAASGEFEESIPLSVRRMMELKPVFTMGQEESAEEAEEVLEPMDYVPDEQEVEAIQHELEELDEVALDEVELESEGAEVREHELEFASSEEVHALEEELAPPEPFELGAEAELEPAPEPAAPEPELEALELDEEGPALDEEEREAGEIEPELAEELSAEEAAVAEEAAAAEEGAPAEEAPAEPEAPEEPRTVEAVTGPEAEAEDEDFFVEEYLGDEEIDEEQIIAAGMDEEIEEPPELSEEDEAELDELLSDEEHLADLDELDELEEESLVAAEGEEPEEEIELEQEEEERILSTLDTESEEAAAAEGAPAEPLFERNFNALEEEGAGPEGEGAAWRLEAEEGGFAIAEEAPAEPSPEEGADVITLGAPEREAAEGGLEEVPESALEEIEEEVEEVEELEAVEGFATVELAEEGEALEPVAGFGEEGEALEPVAEFGEEGEALERVAEFDEEGEGLSEGFAEAEAGLEDVSLAEEAPPAGEGGEEATVAIEFGEGEPDVFAEAESDEEPAWKPKTPPGFVAKPAEDFPEDAVREPFMGPQGDRASPEPPAAPRHGPEEVLEDPDSLTPVLSDEEMQAAAAGEAAAADLADEVQPEELELTPPAEPTVAEDEFAEPALSALTDHALGGVESEAAPAAEEAEPVEAEEAEPVEEALMDIELGEDVEAPAWEEEAGMAEAFEAVDEQERSTDVTRAELDTLLDEEPAPAPAQDEELEVMLGAGPADVEPEAAAAAEAEEEEEPAEATPAEASAGDPEFDSLFSDLRDEIAANPEGERLDDVLRNERIRDHVTALDFSLPQHENTFARAMGVYELPGDGEGPSAYAEALTGGAAPAAGPAAQPAAAPVPPAGGPGAQVVADVGALSLLDADIRAKLGQVLDEIISISVRKAVQEEMPKIMERLSKDA